MDRYKSLIVDELDRVCASSELSNKPVMKKLLAYLVTEYLEGRSDLIKAYSIGVDVFGQGRSFDLDRSAVVRNNAVRLRSLLRTYYLDEGKQNPVRIDIPKGTYVPHITRQGNEGPAPAANLGAQRPSVAVLPFGSRTDDYDLDYLAIGFSQELSDALTKFDDFKIIGIGKRVARGESVGLEFDPVRNMGVRFLIDGDLYAAGNNVRMSVRLIDTSDGSNVWAEGFKFSLEEDDLFELQEGIAKQIVRQIGGEYGKINQRRYRTLLQSRPCTLREQDVLLRFYHHTTVLTQESTTGLQEAVLEALKEDPDSALLNCLAGDLHGARYTLDLPGADEALEKCDYYIEKAYSINPNHQLVRSSLASKCFIFDERERFFRLFEQGREWTAASPVRLGGFALYTCLFGEWERGKALIDEVLDNNAHVPGWLHATLALYHYRRCEFEEALAEANKCQIPGLHWGHIHRTVALSQLGRFEEARAEFQDLLMCRPNFVERGRYMMSIMIREASLLEHVVEGFEKIGVKVD